MGGYRNFRKGRSGDLFQGRVEGEEEGVEGLKYNDRCTSREWMRSLSLPARNYNIVTLIFTVICCPSCMR